MPEGDTIHNLARALAPELEGNILRRVSLRELPGASTLEGARVERVFAIGKHLVILTEQGVALRSHLGMEGGWHRYRPTDVWRRSWASARIVLELDRVTFACFDPPQVAIFKWAARGRHEPLARLGPDLIAEDPDPELLVRRARTYPITRDGKERSIAEILLDQRIAAGIGNVYKSEILFLRGLDPWTAVSAVSDEQIKGLYADAARWLRFNVGRRKRVTAPRYQEGPRRMRGRGLWVYGRARLPCRRCGTLIRTRKLGEQARGTWWCAACQPEGIRPR